MHKLIITLITIQSFLFAFSISLAGTYVKRIFLDEKKAANAADNSNGDSDWA